MFRAPSCLILQAVLEEEGDGRSLPGMLCPDVYVRFFILTFTSTFFLSIHLSICGVFFCATYFVYFPIDRGDQ